MPRENENATTTTQTPPPAGEDDQFPAFERPATETAPNGPSYAEDEPEVVLERKQATATEQPETEQAPESEPDKRQAEEEKETETPTPLDGDDSPEGEGEAGGVRATRETGSEASEPVFDEALMSYAERNGWTRDEVMAFGTQENFVKAIGMLGRKAPPTETPPDAPPSTPSPAAQAGRKTDDQPAKQPATEELDPTIKFDPDGYIDEELAKTFNQKLSEIHAHHQRKTAALEQSLNTAVAYIQQKQQEAELQWLEGKVQALPDELKSQMGRLAEAQPGTPEHGRWRELYATLAGIVQGYQSIATQDSGVKPPSLDILFDRAVASVFSDQSKTIARRQVLNQARRGNGQFTHKPSGRQSVEMTARERAIRAVHEAGEKLGAWD